MSFTRNLLTPALAVTALLLGGCDTSQLANTIIAQIEKAQATAAQSQVSAAADAQALAPQDQLQAGQAGQARGGDLQPGGRGGQAPRGGRPQGQPTVAAMDGAPPEQGPVRGGRIQQGAATRPGNMTQRADQPQAFTGGQQGGQQVQGGAPPRRR